MLGKPTSLIPDAHHAGLKVVVHTFRNENTFLPADFRNGTNPADYGNPIAEYAIYFKQKPDAVFTDHPDTAVAARDDRRHGLLP